MTDEPVIVADIGNTSISFGVFEKPFANVPRPSVTVSVLNDAADFSETRKLFARGTTIHVASVCRPAKETLARFIASETNAMVVEINHRDLPLTIDVANAGQVGIDRLVGAVAANALRAKNRSAIIVDAGSAITIDAVSVSGSFMGGIIMAGFRMRTRALSQQTDQLPLVNPEVDLKEPNLIGTNTTEAIQSGIYWGTVGSIREVVNRLGCQLNDPHVFITGGDMQLISKHIDEADYIPHLVLSGLAIVARDKRES